MPTRDSGAFFRPPGLARIQSALRYGKETAKKRVSKACECHGGQKQKLCTWVYSLAIPEKRAARGEGEDGNYTAV